MTRCSRILCLVLLCAGMAPMALSGTLSDRERARLAPEFQAALAKAFPAAGLTGSALMRAPVETQSDGTPVYEAIIRTSSPDAVSAAGIAIQARFESLVTARVTPAQLMTLASLDEVQYVDPGYVFQKAGDVSVPETGARLVHGGAVNKSQYQGQNVIVVIYDSGIDWKHLDFRDLADNTRSRILFLWDQTLTPVGSETSPSGFGYGVEYTKAQIDNELDGSPAGFVRETDTDGHGTHVAGTAAGNGGALYGKYVGMAPKADLIIIKGGNGSFTETNIINGIAYAQQKRQALGKPVSMNFSLGSRGGPHDGSGGWEAAIDAFVGSPGNVVTVSAGNYADPIHVGGSVPASGSSTVTFTVPSYTPTIGTNNDKLSLDLWISGNPGMTASVTSPTGITYSRAAGEFGDAPNTADGTITLFNTTDGNNGHRNIVFRVTDPTANTPRNGTWTLTLTNSTAFPYTYDGWMYESTVGSSTVTLVGADNAKTLGGSGACAAGAITVAAYETKYSWPSYNGSTYIYTEGDRTSNICLFSSKGPTRDGRLKPEITAPGQGIFSALSSSYDTVGQYTWIAPGQKHVLEQGTSMAAPHVTGAAALLLCVNPGLSAAEIKNLLTSTADGDDKATLLPNTTWGYGKLDIFEAAAKTFGPSVVATRSTVAYDQTGTNFVNTVSGAQKMAVRFTSPFAGKLGGMSMNLTSNRTGVIGTGNAVFEVFTNNGGVPGVKLGNSVILPVQYLTRATWNYVPLLDANVSVSAGTEFFVTVAAQNASDTLGIRSDSLSSPATTSASYNGSSWAAFPKGHLRMRAIVAGGSAVTDVEQAEEGTPVAYSLLQNYPNPFNPATMLQYQLAAPGQVRLIVYDMLGREVSTLVNERQGAGSHTARFDAGRLASGVYFYRLEANGFVQTKKMTLLR